MTRRSVQPTWTGRTFDWLLGVLRCVLTGRVEKYGAIASVCFSCLSVVTDDRHAFVVLFSASLKLTDAGVNLWLDPHRPSWILWTSGVPTRKNQRFSLCSAGVKDLYFSNLLWAKTPNHVCASHSAILGHNCLQIVFPFVFCFLFSFFFFFSFLLCCCCCFVLFLFL